MNSDWPPGVRSWKMKFMINSEGNSVSVNGSHEPYRGNEEFGS